MKEHLKTMVYGCMGVPPLVFIVCIFYFLDKYNALVYIACALAIYGLIWAMGTVIKEEKYVREYHKLKSKELDCIQKLKEGK